MPRILRSLRVSEVSAVDRGAGRGVRIVIAKRDGGEANEMEKRTFSAEERRQAASSGAAMPGGRYPIENVSDLHDAIRAVGRGKGSHAAIRRHIISRARALGAMSAIPEDWKVSKGLFSTLKSALGFSEPTVADVLADTHETLFKSVSDVIGGDGDRVAKIEAVRKLFDECADHLNGAIPESIEKALAAADITAADLGGNAVTKEADMAEQEKARVAPDGDDEDKARKAREEEEKARKARAEEPDGDEEEKARKARAEEDERKAREAREEETEKRHATEIAKRDSELAKRDDAIIALTKRLEALEGDRAAVVFAKRATDMGMPAAFGDVIRKAESGDKAAFGQILKALEAANAQADTGALFKEFGGTGADGGGDAMSQLNAKADELRKRDPNLTQEQAFTKVYSDPANRALAAQERRENRAA